MDRLDLTSSRVIKGSMKFTPKVGKKDKVKKIKKVTKVSSTENNKKLLKKNITSKKSNNEVQQNKNESLNLDTKNEIYLNAKENAEKSNENNNKITVNTINNKNSIKTPTKNNSNNVSVISSIKTGEVQSKTENKRISPTKEISAKSIKSPSKKSSSTDKNRNNNNNNNVNNDNNIIEKTKHNKVIDQKVPSGNKKLIELKNKLIDIDEDSISEVSDDYVRTLELKDSIEDSSNEDDINIKEINNIVLRKFQDNEEKTLVEDIEVFDSQDVENDLSNEVADDTLIIDSNGGMFETSDEEIRNKSKKDLNNVKGDQRKQKDIENDNASNDGENIKLINKDQNKIVENEKIIKDQINEGKNISGSIYDLLDQEEFNQSIDTDAYNKPINHNDEEIENIVHERIIPKRKIGRPPRKARSNKPAKKPIEVIVISDEEDYNGNDKTIDENAKNAIIKREDENELPVKVKKEVDEVEQTLKKNAKEITPKINKRRINRETNIDENEQIVRKAKRSKISKKVNHNDQIEKDNEVENENGNGNGNENENEDENENDNNEQENHQNQEEETVRVHEKEKKTKKSKSKTSKVTKSSKKSKVNETLTSENEEENNENNSVIESSSKAKTKKRKSTSLPSKKSSKKKKSHHEDGNASSNEEEENEPVDISSRTIADIIDNYRGTEISTTQKEIYRLAALKRKATLDRKRGRLSTPEITTTTVPQKPANDDKEKKPKVYNPEKNKTAVQMRVVNGEIVIDQQSTLIDHIDTTDEALPMLKYDENNHITSASFKPKLKPLKWTKDETELFYQCLSIFGTNFSMLAIMFPTRNRKQLLNKYKNEEKINPGHVKYALKHKKALDPDFFYKYSGQDMMEIGREAVEKVKLIEEQRKKDDMELYNIKKKENDEDVKKVVIKNENIYDGNDVKDVKPILAN